MVYVQVFIATDDLAWIKKEAANASTTARLQVMFIGGTGQPGADDTLSPGVVKQTTNTEEALLFFTSVELMSKVSRGVGDVTACEPCRYISMQHAARGLPSTAALSCRFCASFLLPGHLIFCTHMLPDQWRRRQHALGSLSSLRSFYVCWQTCRWRVPLQIIPRLLIGFLFYLVIRLFFRK
jgi:hypothetical protein